MLTMAIVVNAVAVSRLLPLATDIAAKRTSVIAGEKIPSAFATLYQHLQQRDARHISERVSDARRT